MVMVKYFDPSVCISSSRKWSNLMGLHISLSFLFPKYSEENGHWSNICARQCISSPWKDGQICLHLSVSLLSFLPQSQISPIPSLLLLLALFLPSSPMGGMQMGVLMEWVFAAEAASTSSPCAGARARLIQCVQEVFDVRVTGGKTRENNQFIY